MIQMNQEMKKAVNEFVARLCSLADDGRKAATPAPTQLLFTRGQWVCALTGETALLLADARECDRNIRALNPVTGKETTWYRASSSTLASPGDVGHEITTRCNLPRRTSVEIGKVIMAYYDREIANGNLK